MSNKNYNKIYKSQKPEAEEVIDQTVVNDTPVEPAAEPEVQMAIEAVAEPEVLVPEEPEQSTTSAIVVNCAKLNVREEPSPRGAVVAVIDASNEVVICESESFGNYYKVCTASGVEGYCIKDYLKLK